MLGGVAGLGAAGLAGTTAGCDVAAPRAGAPTGPASTPVTPGSSGRPPAAEATTSPDARVTGTAADAALVDDVLGELAAATGVVLAAQRGARRLRADLRPLLVLHGEHVRLLGARLPVDPDDAGRRRDARERLAAVRRREQRLQRVLADAAVAADSGALARLLASMSAAVAQRLVVLPASPR